MSLHLVQTSSLMKQRNRRTDETEIGRKVSLIRPIALDDLCPLDPHPRDGIPATLHVILVDKKCFFL